MNPTKKIKTEISEQDSQIKLPGILIDIDGVLIKGEQGIPRSKEALQKLNIPLHELNHKKYKSYNKEQIVPYTLVTNGGGNLEKNHCKVVNKKMGINEDETYKIKESQMILNFTPLRPIIQEQKDKDQLILIGGSLNYVDLMIDMGISKYITIQEYSMCFPDFCTVRHHTQQEVHQARALIKQRLQLPEEQSFAEPFQIYSIFMLYEPIQQEEAIQIICDLCSTTNGTVSKVFPLPKLDSHIPIYIVNNDFVFKDSFSLPRFAFGAFNDCLVNCAKQIYGIDLKLTLFGKPEKLVFDYAKDSLKKQNPDVEISNYYMIGDNLLSDIKGANNSDCISILVKTGVFQGEENCKINPAKYLVNDLYEALELIYELEGIQQLEA